MRRRRWETAVPVLLATAWAVGCASSSTSLEAERIQGRWSWVRSEGGIAGMVVTPASAGYELDVRFDATGEARLFRDGQLQRITSYRLALGQEGGSFPGEDVVLFDPPLFGGWEEMRVAFPHPDTLLLVDGCCDGFAYTLARAGGAP